VGCGTVSTSKRGISAAEYCLHLPDNLWKNNGILFTQSGKFCLIFQSISWMIFFVVFGEQRSLDETF
jgi:hypothetical protein